jgi:hypothetical protein
MLLINNLFCGVLFAVYVVIIQRFYHFVNPILAVGLFVAFLQQLCQTKKRPALLRVQKLVRRKPENVTKRAIGRFLVF